MQFARQEIARVVEGELHGADGPVDGASTDSREMSAGALFVPIRAERDGHDFIAAALQRGAGAHLTENRSDSDGSILVTDCTVAIAKLGKYARKRMAGPVIGITGSSGKTSTKDLCGPILRASAPAAVSEKSLNNELGVPLTLINAPSEANWGVLEMGARGVGHIAYLCEIGEPTVGVITNIGTAHRELFKSALLTATAKGELLQALPKNGTAVLNVDDEYYETLSALSNAPVLGFSSSGSGLAEVVAEEITMSDELTATFMLRSPWGRVPVTLGARGRHQVDNALAAAAATLTAGATMDDVVRGLSDAQSSPWRMELTTLQNGALLLNDAYNANPSSMKAAIDALVALDRKRFIAVLGTMAELGEEGANLHREISAYAKAKGIDLLVSVGEPRYVTTTVVDITAAQHWLTEHEAPGPSDAILVKGSRVAGLERLAHALIQRFGATA